MRIEGNEVKFESSDEVLQVIARLANMVVLSKKASGTALTTITGTGPIPVLGEDRTKDGTLFLRFSLEHGK